MSSAIEGNPSGTADVPEESVGLSPPPWLERCQHRIRVVLGGQTIADSRNALRVLETTHPPTYYIPPSDVRPITSCRHRAGACASGKARRTTGTCEAGPRKAWMRRGAIPDQRSRSPRHATTWRFIPRELTPATSVTSGSSTGRRFLRRLDHQQRARPVQGPACTSRVTACRAWLTRPLAGTTWTSDATRPGSAPG